MAPAQIECISQQQDGKFDWTPIRTVKNGVSELLPTIHGDILLTGTAKGFSLQQQDKPLDDVAVTDTDEFNLPTAVRRVTTPEGELQIRAVEEL